MTASWLGFAVDGVDGEQAGRVRGLFTDAERGEPSWLVVELAGRLSLLRRRRDHIVVVPMRSCAGGGGRVWAAHRRDELRRAPTVDPTRPLLREHELTICSHYGIGERVGRAAEVAGRGEGTVTANPA